MLQGVTLCGASCLYLASIDQSMPVTSDRTRDGCQHPFMSIQELGDFEEHEVPWVAAAILRSMAALPLEPSAQPGPAAQTLEKLLYFCCTMSDSNAQSAVHEALRAAIQQPQQHAAGGT